MQQRLVKSLPAEWILGRGRQRIIRIPEQQKVKENRKIWKEKKKIKLKIIETVEKKMKKNRSYDESGRIVELVGIPRSSIIGGLGDLRMV